MSIFAFMTVFHHNKQQDMSGKVELNSFDLRYESYRQQSPVAEKTLLSSIIENGIRDPLQGVDVSHSRILLDGFKRYRCAKKLGIEVVAYRSLGSDEAFAILELIRMSNARSLTILEQARLIEQLRSVYKMSIVDIATQLERSKAWVSMRSGILSEMGEKVQGTIFSGAFPAYAYLYTLRPFIRMNRVPKKDIEDFVGAVAGKQLSIRDIDVLAQGYFKGGDAIRQQIQQGNISWGLQKLKHTESPHDNCTEFERGMLRDLEITQKCMQRLIYKSGDTRLKNNTFFVQANLLCGGIIRQIDNFITAIKDFYDRSKQA